MTIAELNNLDKDQLRAELTKCCGAAAWVDRMLGAFPAADLQALLVAAEKAWYSCEEKDWLEAFRHHPRIGDIHSLAEKYGDAGSAKGAVPPPGSGTEQWAASEQAGVNTASQEVLMELADGNRIYEEKFGYIFIVCATGMSAMEMLALLKGRLMNAPGAEINMAMMEQNKITKIRLEKLVS
ncbi:MAG TPA: 2-oxo-4-hydroxy-4-carboxy-5-ureidoimidazoline decarboxylase [Puia sp.]|nr:2-oxo-4-hydroxy-4-carboxy-5-ureidoimidazoline decarboxylase [Puia sp.]